MKKSLFLILAFFFALSLSAQNQTLKGVVLDANDEPLIGASIMANNNKVGTATDIDGKFVLNLPAGITSVEVSYVGYETQIVNIQGKTEVKIVLQEKGNVLEETVVVGYGVQKKATMTGAVSAVSGDALTKRSVASLSTALQGTMPGVTIQQSSGEPGADGSNIRVRGIGSLYSSSDPLVLVDGIEMDINQVDMSTVESISTLKDASSAAIYGSRASNGVILITTKRGKSGKVSVSYSGYATVQTPTNMPEVVGAADYLEGLMNSKINARDGSMTSDKIASDMAEIEAYRTYKADNWNRYDTNWKEATMSDAALMQNHSVTLSGGSEALTYFGAISFLDQGGLIKNNHYNRLNIRANTDSKILPWLKLSNEIAYRRSEQKTPTISTPKSIINKSLYMLPTLSAAKEIDGNWGYGKNGDNPVAQAEDGGTKKVIRPEMLLSATFTATPIEGLELQAQYSWRKTDARTTDIMTPYVTSLKGNVFGGYPSNDARVSESLSETFRNYYRLQAAYDRSFDKHNGKILFGFQAEDNTIKSISAGRTGFEFDQYYLNNGDGATATAGGSANVWALASFYGRLNYDYDSKYLFEFSGRYDGSSRFSQDNRWGFFPSASIGWVISEENFMKDKISFLDHLKFRASYGMLGNQDLVSANGFNNYFPYTAVITPGYSYWLDKNLSSGVAQTQFANPDIKWEKSTQLNFGLDAVLLNQALTISFDYYIKKNLDMLQLFPLPYYVGLNPPYLNAGDMENKGWEFMATYRNKINKVNFAVTATLNNNENKITNLKGRTYPDRSKVEGYPLNGIWGFVTDGYLQNMDDVNNAPLYGTSAYPGYVKYVKTNGTDPRKIEDVDKVYLGDPFPHYEYGLKLEANWNNFDFLAFFQGVGKRDVSMAGIGVKPFANGANLFTHQLDSWTEDNPNAKYPILLPESNSGDNFVTSDKWVKSGAYMRLKNVMVGYTLPRTFAKKIKFENLRIYVSAQNLFTVSSFYKGYDPEVNYGGDLGGEFYPIMQTFTFGLDFKF